MSSLPSDPADRKFPAPPTTAPPAIFFANGIGDHVMVLPALRAVTSLFHEAPVLLGMRGIAEVVFRDVRLARVVDVALKNEHGRNVFEPAALVDVPQQVGDLVSLNPWHSPAVDALLERLRPRRSIGMYERFDVHVPPKSDEHSVDRAFRVALQLAPDLRIEDFSGPPALGRAPLGEARALLDRHLARGQKVLAFHNETLPHKVWSAGSLERALRAFLEQHLDFVAVGVGRARQLPGSARDAERVIELPLALDVAFGVIANADLFLGCDSCMLHVADFQRVPGVGLFGPEPSAPLGCEEMGFRFGPHRHVSGGGAMDRIRVETVVAALASARPHAGALPRRHRD